MSSKAAHESARITRPTSGSSRGLGSQLPARSNAGGVLVLALVAVATVAGLAAAFLQLSTSVSRRQVQMRDRMRAFYVAEAALSEAWTAVQLRKTGAVGSEAEPAKFGDGLFWVEATDSGDFIRLESTAMVATGTATLAIVVTKGESSVANLGVHSGGDLDLPPGTVLDAYDSRLGYGDDGAISGKKEVDIDALLLEFGEQVEEPTPKAPALGGGALLAAALPIAGPGEVLGGGEEPAAEEPEFLGRVGAGGDITITGTEELPTVIEGDVTPGTTGILTETGTVTVTGSTDASTLEVELPDIQVPSLATLEGVTHTGNSPLLVLPVKAALPNLSIGRGAEVIVEGPTVLVLETLTMAAGASLTLDTSGGPVTIHVTSDATIAPSASLSNLSEDPTDLSLQISAEPESPISLPAGTPVHGMIYAPDASLVLPEGFELFGSLAAGQITFGGPPKLHFDQYIDEYVNDLAKPTLLSWRIVELINDGKGGGNPFVRLGVDPTVLLSPADAHVAQPIEIDYVDSGGFAQSFTGTEDTFDWNNVLSVTDLTRDGDVVVASGQMLAGSKNSGSGSIDSLIDQVEVLKYDPAALRTMLLAESPLPISTLRKLLKLDVPLPSAIVKEVFLANSPASPKVLAELARTPTVTSQDIADVLAANSPGLASDVLKAAQNALTPAQFATLSGLQ